MTDFTLLYYSILNYQPASIKILRENFNIIELPDPGHDRLDVLSKADVMIAPLGYYCGKDKMDNSPKLKIIGSNTTGHPHIDIDYAARMGIKVITLKGETEFLKRITPTAELAWGLVIAIARNIYPAFSSVLNGTWNRRPFGSRSMLSQMSLGVAGCGRLGSMVAGYGNAFGMTVRYYDPYVRQDKSWLARVDTLEDLVAVSDIVTIHIPHEPETENLFDRKLFSSFKKGAFLVNTSRGELVDHEALLECLENKTLAGAAMDVFEDEFTPGFDITNFPLWRYAKQNSNLLLTPHIGGSTISAWQMTEEHTINMILNALKEM